MLEHVETAVDADTARYPVDTILRALYSGILRRQPDAKGFQSNLNFFSSRPVDEAGLATLIRNMLSSPEYLALAARDLQRRSESERATSLVDPVQFRTPQDLAVTPSKISRVLIVGSCLAEVWAQRMARMSTPCASDVYPLGQLPESPARAITDYDFQIVQLSLRSLIPDNAFARLSQADVAGHESLFAHAVDWMQRYLQNALRWNQHFGIMTFVLSFIAPQQNLVGRLLPRYDLRNPVYFVERLNEKLASELLKYRNAHFFDMNEVIGTHGRRTTQEDVLAQFNHAGFLSNFNSDYDMNRLETAKKASDFYEWDVERLFLSCWREFLAMYRTLRQIDTVKLVVTDLDDTLWRGVIAESDPDELPTTEGWPKAYWETLAFLKRRGVLLAIISKNDEERVQQVWERILGHNLRLEDFAIRRINWRSKAENMAEILAHVNLLPESVVYIDDNPAERAGIKAAFPAIRVLGGTPLTWRRILLWSAEAQIGKITAESTLRTEMVRGQVAREEQRKVLSASDFLASLQVRLALWRVDDISNAKFGRVLELVNKTNQFNTTGRRWTEEQCQAAVKAGIEFYAFAVADAYTDYGLVGVFIIDGNAILQFVMSCRVMGLEVEAAAIAQITRILHARGDTAVFAAMIETDRNLPCRSIYAGLGFEAVEGGWLLPSTSALPTPAHITVEQRQP